MSIQRCHSPSVPRSPLHNAVEQNDVNLLRELLEKKGPEPGDINPVHHPLPAPCPITPRSPPAHRSSSVQEDPLAAYAAMAADERPDVNQRDDSECTPLHLAILLGRLEAMQARPDAELLPLLPLILAPP